jgi:hypothetical protein
MLGYTIVMKWWWKKLLKKIKWELVRVHPKNRDSLMELSALSGRPNLMVSYVFC